MNSNNKLAGKNVLITAGAQGIGESITRKFIDSGANVATHYFSSADTANELVKYAKGTRVNAVAPGLILGTSFHNTHTTKESADKTTAGIPIQRAGNSADVARAVIYLASEYDGFITGATLDINGGVYNM